jgi:hypothetical protein
LLDGARGAFARAARREAFIRLKKEGNFTIRAALDPRRPPSLAGLGARVCGFPRMAGMV